MCQSQLACNAEASSNKNYHVTKKASCLERRQRMKRKQGKEKEGERRERRREREET